VEIDAQGGAALARSGGDADGFELWVSPYLVKLRAVASRLVASADAADVVQETLLRAWQRWETYSPERGEPLPWLITILVERARRHRTRGRPKVGLSSVPLFGPPVAASGTADLGQRAVDRLDVEIAIATLPRRQRQTVTLFYLADLSVAEVSTVLGIRPGSVKAHLAAARSALRRVLEEQ
jgi:RNA polymerase sigma-70 factor (ECF subfamily)